MKAIEQLERLKKIDKLIQNQKTGKPEEFSAKLGICQSHLFNLIEDLKIMGAPIRYSRIRQTYYYASDFEMQLHYSLCFKKKDQLLQIFGGYVLFSLTPFFSE